MREFEKGLKLSRSLKAIQNFPKNISLPTLAGQFAIKLLKIARVSDFVNHKYLKFQENEIIVKNFHMI